MRRRAGGTDTTTCTTQGVATVPAQKAAVWASRKLPQRRNGLAFQCPACHAHGSAEQRGGHGARRCDRCQGPEAQGQRARHRSVWLGDLSPRRSPEMRAAQDDIARAALSVASATEQDDSLGALGARRHLAIMAAPACPAAGPHRRVVLLGRTGAGKSTLGNILVGAHRFETGSLARVSSQLRRWRATRRSRNAHRCQHNPSSLRRASRRAKRLKMPLGLEKRPNDAWSSWTPWASRASAARRRRTCVYTAYL
jgi:hypothetical protein